MGRFLSVPIITISELKRTRWMYPIVRFGVDECPNVVKLLFQGENEL